MSEQAVLDMRRLQRFLQERIVLEIDHPERQVRTRPPVGVDFPEFVSIEGCSFGC
jgi:hypothetical protein